MKKALSLLIACVMLVSMLTVFVTAAAWDGTATADFTGSGTADDPYIIASAENLAALAAKVNAGTDYSGKYFTQTADIDLGSREWTPIGSGSAPFYGVYDGKCHTISNMKITALVKYGGLFGFAGSKGTVPGGIANLTVTGEISIDNATTTQLFIGSFVGLANNNADCRAVFVNLTSDVNISIKETTNQQSRIGGIFGETRQVDADNLVNNGSIEQNGSSTMRIAGITGFEYGTVLRNCVNNGSVTVNNTSGYGVAAGIVGQMQGNANTCKLINCVNNGKITANTAGSGNICYCGGIVAWTYSANDNYNFEITNCVNTGEIYSSVTEDCKYNTYSAGFIPVVDKAGVSVTGSVNTGSVTYKNKDNFSGGIYGRMLVNADTVSFKDNVSVGAAFGSANTENDKVVFTGNTENAAADAAGAAANKLIANTGKFVSVKINGFPTDVIPKPDETTGPEDNPGTDVPATGDSVYLFAGIIIVTAFAGAAMLIGKRRTDAR